MGKSGQKNSKLGHVSAQVWNERLVERVAAFLRARYPHKTQEFVAADIEISASTVRKWLDGASAPSLGHIARMIYAYEAEFLAAVFPGLTFVEGVVALGRLDAAERMAIEAQAQVDALFGRKR